MSTGAWSPSIAALALPTGSRLATAGHPWSEWSRTSNCRWQRTEEFLRWFLSEIPIEPLWLCPLRLREASTALLAPGEQHPWPLYPLRPRHTYVNVGFWSAVAATPGRPGATNRRIEEQVTALGGHKSLYSEAFYGPEEFAGLYCGAAYAALRDRYDPQHRLTDLYTKVVRNR